MMLHIKEHVVNKNDYYCCSSDAVIYTKKLKIVHRDGFDETVYKCKECRIFKNINQQVITLCC